MRFLTPNKKDNIHVPVFLDSSALQILIKKNDETIKEMKSSAKKLGFVMAICGNENGT